MSVSKVFGITTIGMAAATALSGITAPVSGRRGFASPSIGNGRC